uniref:Uncharacterized protein n=1 Tax=Cucumis melo TaxID=3656 RepID=A0A9I9DNM9_CUCME
MARSEGARFTTQQKSTAHDSGRIVQLTTRRKMRGLCLGDQKGAQLNDLEERLGSQLERKKGVRLTA